jgi:hypothetical protein
MKRVLHLLALLMIFVTGGCNDYAIKTTINPDGSFERIVVCNGDSLGVLSIHLPYVFDSSWTIVSEGQHGDSHNFTTTAKKKYSNAEQLREEFLRGRDSSKLQILCRVEKHFRWFFTYYLYIETLPSYSIYRHESIDSFFTPTEIGLMKEDKDSVLSKRIEDFWYRNIIDEFIERIQHKAIELNDPSLPPSVFTERKEALMEGLLKGKDDKPDDMARIIEQTLRPRPVKKLSGAMDSIFTTMTKELKAEADLDLSFKNEVTMPGILMTSNAKKIEGNKVMWDCRSNKYFDVVMSAESRRVNLWTVIVTMIICLGLVIGLVLPLFHRARG